MNWISSHWIVLLFFLVFLVLTAYHAWVAKRRTRGLVDYYVGGRSMGGVAIGLSFFATYSSTNSFVGYSGQAYAYGMPWLLLAPSAVVFSLIAWLWIAPRLRIFTASLNSVTIPDFIGFRFGSNGARFLAALIVLLASLFYMTAVFKGIGNLLEAFLEIPYGVAIALVFVIVVVYTAVGGFFPWSEPTWSRESSWLSPPACSSTERSGRPGESAHSIYCELNPKQRCSSRGTRRYLSRF